MQIRRATPHEHTLLSDLAREAKAHWGYSEATLARWRIDLTISAGSIAAYPTFVAERDGMVLGFFQLAAGAGMAVLEHLWVRPSHMRQGIGRALLARALDEARAFGARALRIDSDPHAEAFYRACGAVRVGQQAAPIEGQPGRVRPRLVLAIRPDTTFDRAVPTQAA